MAPSNEHIKAFDAQHASSAWHATFDEKALGADYHYARKPSLLAQGLRSVLPEPRRGSYVTVEPGSPTFDLKADTSPNPGWRPLIISTLRRAVVVGPVITLMVFGILHIFQVGISGARFFWDNSEDDFLPNWGQQGHYGEYVAKYPTDATRDVIPITCHSHNDYWRRIPLFEALHYGCIGVEADVWLVQDDLYVGHNTASLTANRTFQSLYVEPIVELLNKQNPTSEFANTTGHGVYDTSPGQTLVLLVDMKTEGNVTWPAVQAQLEPLREKGYLTYWNGTDTISGAVTVVGTGNTPFNLITANTTYRDIFFDAPLDQLWEMPRTTSSSSTDSTEVDTGTVSGVSIGASESANPQTGSNTVNETPASNSKQKRQQGVTGLAGATPDDFNSGTSYYASVSLHQAVGKIWRGHLSKRQIEIIRGQIRGAKRRGLKARYWDTPAWPISLRNHIWYVLMREGADILNVDDLRSASRLDWRRMRHEWW